MADLHSDAALLALWERAAGAHPAARDDALLAARGEPVPRALGPRNAALLDLRARLFGPAWLLRADCPACGQTVEFEIDAASMAQALGPARDAAAHRALDIGGRRLHCRAPDIDDLRAVAGHPDAAAELLRRCIEVADCDNHPLHAGDELPAGVAAAAAEAMQALDPGAVAELALSCPDCGKPWRAAIDPGDCLWRELGARAERLLLDVDALAREYGWREDDILSLGPVRRAAYLQLIGAAP